MLTPTNAHDSMSEQAQKVYAVRHGKTEWSLSGRHTDLTDISLTKRGRQRAKLLRPPLTREVFTLALTVRLSAPRRLAELPCTERNA
jgi:probable phosphoglycerate mutase